MTCVVITGDKEMGEKRTYEVIEDFWHLCKKRCNVDECDVIGDRRGTGREKSYLIAKS